jgi:hypothetical protein
MAEADRGKIADPSLTVSYGCCALAQPGRTSSHNVVPAIGIRNISVFSARLRRACRRI